LWALAGVFAMALWPPFVALLRGGGLGVVLGLLIGVFELSAILAAAQISADLWSGRFDDTHSRSAGRPEGAP